MALNCQLCGTDADKLTVNVGLGKAVCDGCQKLLHRGPPIVPPDETDDLDDEKYETHLFDFN